MEKKSQKNADGHKKTLDKWKHSHKSTTRKHSHSQPYRTLHNIINNEPQIY